MRNEPLAISLLLFATVFLAEIYGWLTALTIASALTMLTLYSPTLRLGDFFWTQSRKFTIISDGGNVAFVQRVALAEEGIMTLWAMLGPLLFVPSLIILRRMSSGPSITFITQAVFTAALLSIVMVSETLASLHGTSLRLVRVSIISGLIAFAVIKVMGYASDPVTVSLSSSYLSVLLAADIRNVPYLASNGITNVVIGGQGVRDALVTVPVTTSLLVWILIHLLPG